MTISDLYWWARENGYDNKELLINYNASDYYYSLANEQITENNLHLAKSKEAVIIEIE